MKTVILAIVCLALATGTRADELKPVNKTVMLRGYCFAGSRPDKQALGGYGTSDNLPKKLVDNQLGKEGEVSLIALPAETVQFDRVHAGFRLLLINRTKAEVAFAASDSRISLIQEAFAQGRWRPIEYLPSSWCGNSGHRVFLPAGHYWEFAAPKYVGAEKTMLRFILQGKRAIYSNAFEGSVNHPQFTTKEGHAPKDIMDPYNE